MITSTALSRLVLQIFKNSQIRNTVPPERYLLWSLLSLVAQIFPSLHSFLLSELNRLSGLGFKLRRTRYRI